tara:strand:- start:877 stop:1725 length:849 start_codon:yes stop_codon:yes gene_type:complete
MKILIIQENGRHEKNKNFRECFSLKRAFENHGHQAEVWGLNHKNFEITPDWDGYDIIFNLENYDTSGWVPSLNQCNAYKILWSIDAHCRGVDIFDNTFKEGGYELLLHSTRDYATGANRVWFPNAFDDDLVVKMNNANKQHFIGFCGNYVNRKTLIDKIDKDFMIKKDIFVIGSDMVKAINSYKIHFNKNISNDINYRSFETIGCSTALLTNKNYQYNKLGFKDMQNCILYSDLLELKDKLRYLSGDTKKLEEIENCGYNLSFQHTYKIRIKKLLTFLSEKV